MRKSYKEMKNECKKTYYIEVANIINNKYYSVKRFDTKPMTIKDWKFIRKIYKRYRDDKLIKLPKDKIVISPIMFYSTIRDNDIIKKKLIRKTNKNNQINYDKKYWNFDIENQILNMDESIIPNNYAIDYSEAKFSAHTWNWGIEVKHLKDIGIGVGEELYFNL